jgi:hypothetical protein
LLLLPGNCLEEAAIPFSDGWPLYYGLATIRMDSESTTVAGAGLELFDIGADTIGQRCILNDPPAKGQHRLEGRVIRLVCGLANLLPECIAAAPALLLFVDR